MELWGFKKLACDSLTLQIGRVQLCSNNWAFAAVLSDGSVVTWGNWVYGGSSTAVQDRLKGVHHIQATSNAFAAIG